ncbi:MAG TPA: ergothioneine biosynthesis protein EgtB [Acidimicrobiia bacterium]|nr:ergothioneine biosynthesis protein EgtB [Acidimicrobiia bacterium]
MTTTSNASRPRLASTAELRAELLATYRRVRALTEALACPLSPEDQTVQSMPDVSPTKWHRAHTTWFFETFVLTPHVAGYESPDSAYAYLFNSYYEQVGERHPRAERGLLSRPSVGEVGAYRRHVDAAMDEMFATADDDVFACVAHIVETGCHHEQQHQELLLMDIKHVLSCNPLAPRYDVRAPFGVHGGARDARFVSFDGGPVEVGHHGDAFSFDNETPRHPVLVEPFRLADRLVTVGEWKAFIADGGYTEPTLWLSDGWATVHSQGWIAPLYWHADDGDWTVFTLEGRRRVDDAEPVVHVSHYEADAFARWAGARLPTEFEWEHAAGQCDTAREHELHLHPRAANGSSTLAQLDGEVWQWTASAYLPYPRFAPAAGAIGEYNGKFMSNQMVLRGGACITPPGHTRTTYRNFFPPSARWAFSGVRLAADA